MGVSGDVQLVLVPLSKACRVYVRISDATPKARNRLKARGRPPVADVEIDDISPRPFRCTLPAE